MPGIAASPSRVKATDLVAPVTIKIGGTTLDPTRANKVSEVVVKKERMRPDSAYVRIADPKHELVNAGIAKMGQDLEILMGGPEDASAKTLFKGVLMAVEPEFGEGGVFVGFRAYDKSRLMTQGCHTRTFQNQTAGDIVKKVAGPYFSSITIREPTSAPFEHLMQSNESDWDFVWRLARRIGYEFVVDEDKAEFRMAGATEGSAPWMQYGGSAEKGHRLFSFRPRVTSANLPKNVKASYVNHKGERIKVSVPLSGGEVKFAKNISPGAGEFGELDGKADFAIPNIVAKNEAEMKAALESARDALIATGFEAEGVSEGDPELRPGKTIEIKNVGKFSGEYVISECTHVYRGGGGFKTKFHIASRSRSLLEAVGGSGGASGGGSASNVSVVGASLVRGEVTNINDPDNLGRVRIKFPSLADTDDPEGFWARIATNSAGKERGVLMMPQVGDKVVVGFENGDTRVPFVLGSIYEGKAEPGDILVQKDGSYSLRSDKKVLMKSKEDINIETDTKYEVKVQKDATLKNGMATFLIESDKEIVLKAPDIKLDASKGLELKGGMQAQLKSKMVTVAADMNLELKGSAMVTVSGGLIKLG